MISVAKRLVVIVGIITLTCNALLFALLGTSYHIGTLTSFVLLTLLLTAAETIAIGINIAYWSKKLFW